MYSWNWAMFILGNGTRDQDMGLVDKFSTMENIMKDSGRMTS